MLERSYTILSPPGSRFSYFPFCFFSSPWPFPGGRAGKFSRVRSSSLERVIRVERVPGHVRGKLDASIQASGAKHAMGIFPIHPRAEFFSVQPKSRGAASSIRKGDESANGCLFSQAHCACFFPFLPPLSCRELVCRLSVIDWLFVMGSFSTRVWTRR